MPRAQLKQALEALHSQLEDAENIDEDMERRLRTAMGEIHDALDGSQAQTPFEALRQRIVDAERDFEESHASLSSALGRISDLLSRVGL